MSKFYLTLDRQEVDAIVKMSTFERRDPRDQAAILIRQSLERAGLLQKAEGYNYEQNAFCPMCGCAIPKTHKEVGFNDDAVS